MAIAVEDIREFTSGERSYVVPKKSHDAPDGLKEPSDIAFAKRVYTKHNVEFRIADLNETLPFSDNTFDAIVSFEAIEHVSRQNELLKEKSFIFNQWLNQPCKI